MNDDIHPNTKKFLQIMSHVDFEEYNKEHPNEDFGQYVRRLSEETGNIEDGHSPSDEAIRIAQEVQKRYKRKKTKPV